ncbi:MAG: hypothetical protein COX77_03735 [Candidatus Komeilibacteria bacterium CG_4_10_14_0_2_um_filter_37_10]|uniref:DUF11 domain-containing protein n=1 Tax=Candidatus Komeilibacteria bacterium CG_4_10_14_0_2_um_filter_37_10 TaxID=1974470 RepID=A0A2M7VE43_9BACT|nr:MAG: hypothetical protein COX77_03735 [Candidatus Komeilibacteria bacterium CG_4_10_14_0_2_um_filter_37_10]
MDNNEQKIKEEAVVVDNRSVLYRFGSFVNRGVVNIFVNYTPIRYRALYQQRRHWLWIDLGVIALVILLFAQLLFWWHHPLTSNQYLDLQLRPVGELVSGQDYQLRVTFHNKNKTTLVGSYLSIDDPGGYHFKFAQQNNQELISKNNIIQLGDLPAGASGEIILIGWQWATVAENIPWAITWHYGQENWPHNKIVRSDIKFTSSALQISIEAPQQVYSGNSFIINILLENKSVYPIDQARIRLYPTADWYFIDPALTVKNDYQLLVNKIAANSPKNVQIKARLQTDKNDIAHLGLATAIGNDDIFYEQNWQDLAVQTNNLQVVLDLLLTESKQYFVGQKYSGRLYYFNREKKDLYNVTINMKSQGLGVEANFTPSTLNIPILQAQSENYLPFEFIISNTNGESTNKIAITSEFSWQENQQSHFLRSKLYYLTVTPSLSVDAKLYYHTPTGEQIGIGPLPPKVNKSTRYWLSIQVAPTIGNMQQMLAKVILNPQVTMIDYNTSLGRIESNGNIVWIIDKYDRNNDTETRLNLYLEIKPTINDLGKTMELVRNIDLVATSSFDSQPLTQSIGSIDNDLSTDQIQPNNGQVVN